MRRQLFATPWENWRDRIVGDLRRPHPKLENYLTHLDVWLWGHGMAAPAPGYLWGESGRPRIPETSVAGLFKAHTDCSGISIFEEAQYRGVVAARSARRFVEGV
jgi:hypothetical protein